MATTSEIRLEIERRILSGELPGGARLPSIRSLADQHSVAPGTVAVVFRQLADAGLVVTGRGRQGTRVAHPSGVLAPLPLLQRDLPGGVLDARFGSPDRSMLPSLAEAIAHASANPTGSYGSSIVHPELQQIGSRLFGDDNIAAEAMTVTNGSMDAIDRVLRAHLRVGDRVGVEDPGHVPVHQVVRSSGLAAVPLPVDDFGIVSRGLEEALVDDRLAAVIMTPRAQNPTGAALSPARARQLTDVLSGHPEVLVIQDDHAGPVAGVDFHYVDPPGPRWMVIRSMGKSLGPDLRVALAVGDQDTIDRVSYGFSNGPGWVSHILQRAVAFLLADAETTDLVEHAAHSYRTRRRRLVSSLQEHGLRAFGRSGFNVWLPVGSEQDVVEQVRQAGFAIAAGEQWRIDSPPAVRISVSALSGPEIDELAAVLALSQQTAITRSATM